MTCPDPLRCPVPERLPPVPTVVLAAGRAMFRGYDGRWGYDEHDPGYGDTRFAPVLDPLDDEPLPSIYLGETASAALLETVFHEVGPARPRFVHESSLRSILLAHVAVPVEARVADLRDDALAAAGLERSQLPAVSPEHLACTRRAAVQLLAEDPTRQGLLWHSRRAELLGRPPTEVAVLYGRRYPHGRGSWPRLGPGSQNLYEGPGRLLVDELALELDATVVRDD